MDIAAQISTGPAMSFARSTGAHVRPHPDTHENIARGPEESLARYATISSGLVVVIQPETSIVSGLDWLELTKTSTEGADTVAASARCRA